jgi:hypothetical protein
MDRGVWCGRTILGDDLCGERIESVLQNTASMLQVGRLLMPHRITQV